MFDYLASGFLPYDPDIIDPYPKSGWEEVTDFRYESHLYLARSSTAIIDGRNREAEYILAAEYRCSCKVDGAETEIVIPSGMMTDLTSSPWAARLLVDRVGPHLEAAIVHDFLFLAWQDLPGRGARREDFRFANEVMDAAMKAAGIGRIKRAMIMAAVSSPVGWATYRGENPKPRYVTVPDPFPHAAPATVDVTVAPTA